MKMKTGDAVIDEIRESRQRLSREVGNDTAKYIEHLKKIEAKYSAQIRKYRKARGVCHVAVARQK